METGHDEGRHGCQVDLPLLAVSIGGRGLACPLSFLGLAAPRPPQSLRSLEFCNG